MFSRAPKFMRAAWLAVVFALPLALSAGCMTPTPAGDYGDPPPMDARNLAPELDSGLAWLNTDRPLSLREDLKGHVVLLDFWTYCCINCIHVLPDLKYLEHKYKDQPFMVIGVHSAKFENEGTRQNVRSAILRYEIEHPVVVDDQMSIWRSYGIRSWPTLVLIDSTGKAVGAAPGEGNREMLDNYIEQLLAEGKKNGTLAKEPVRVKREGRVRAAGGLAFPSKVVADKANGRVFTTDSNHNRIVVSSWPDGQGHSDLIQIIGQGEEGARDGTADKAQFHHPHGMALGKDKLYVADTGNHLLRAVSLKDWSVSTVAGTGRQVYDRQGGGTGTAQGLNSPWDLVLSPDEKTLYIAMAGPHQLWRMHLDTKVVEAFVGSGIENIVDDEFPGAQLAQPSGLALDGDNLYFADSEVSAIRVADLKRKMVRTILGHGLFEFGDVDGGFDDARLQHALGVQVWEGQLLVADTYNHKIKLVDPVARSSASYLGLGEPAANRDGKLGLYEPGGLSVAGDDLFIADTNNHRVVWVNLDDKTWHEMVIQGLEPPRSEMEGVSGATVVTDPVTLNPVEESAWSLTVNLPKGFKLNEEAPTSVRIQNGQDVLAVKTLHTMQQPVTVTLPKGAVKNEATFDVMLRSAYCTEEGDGACVPLSVNWQVPVSGAEDGVSDVRLEATEVPPKR